MTSERIKEIQLETAYPNSVSVQQALLKVWNECEQAKQRREKTAELVKKCQERMKSIRDKNYFTLRFGKTKNEIVMFMTTENSGIESIKITDNPDCGVKGITFK